MTSGGRLHPFLLPLSALTELDCRKLYLTLRTFGWTGPNPQLNPPANRMWRSTETRSRVGPVAGMERPDVIDLVLHDPYTGEFAAIMFEGRSWGTDPVQVGQLRDKTNTYASYFVDGQFLAEFPEGAGHLVRLQIDCVDEPDSVTAKVIGEARRWLEQYGIRVHVNHSGPVT